MCIHLISKCLLSAYYVHETMKDIGVTLVNKKDMFLSSWSMEARHEISSYSNV